MPLFPAPVKSVPCVRVSLWLKTSVPLLVIALLAGMVGFGTWTARGRAKAVPGATGPIALALTVAAAVTLGLVLALGVFKAEPRYLVPVGGMVIGNSMTAVAVALNRLADQVAMNGKRPSTEEIEASLRENHGLVKYDGVTYDFGGVESLLAKGGRPARSS